MPCFDTVNILGFDVIIGFRFYLYLLINLLVPSTGDKETSSDPDYWSITDLWKYLILTYNWTQNMSGVIRQSINNSLFHKFTIIPAIPTRMSNLFER